MVKSIGQSIQLGKPFRTVGAEALVALLRTADMVADVVRQGLCDSGLSLQQYNVLRILRGAGAGGLRTYDVVPRMVSRAPNITRLVDKLEEKGLLERTRSERDRRAIRLRITRSGLRLIDRLDGAMGEADARATQGLSAAELKRLVGLLDRLRHPLEQERDQVTPRTGPGLDHRGSRSRRTSV